MMRIASAALLFTVLSGCALLTKQEPVSPRYYSPERPEMTSPAPAKTAPGLSIRLGTVGGSAYLKDRIAHRDSEHGFGFYEELRWTERPEVYLERALEKSLFEQRGVARAVSAADPALTVQLIEFEEITGASPRVRLRLTYAIHDERTVFGERTLAIERPLSAGSDAEEGERVAADLGEVLREAAGRVADEAVAVLVARASRSN